METVARCEEIKFNAVFNFAVCRGPEEVLTVAACQRDAVA